MYSPCIRTASSPMCLPTSLCRSSLSNENSIAIFTESRISAGAAHGEAASIIPGQLAVTEAARAVSERIREEHRENFIVAGGAPYFFTVLAFRRTRLM